MTGKTQEDSVQVKPHSSRIIAPALMLAIVTFISVKSLFLAQVLYFPTVNRVTYAQPYNISIIGSTWDSLILAILLAVTSTLITKEGRIRVAFAAVATASIALFLTQQFLALDILSLAAGFIFVTTSLLAARKGPSSRFDYRLLLISIMIAQAAVLVRWLVFPAYPTPIFGDWSWKLNEVYASLQGVAGLIVPGIVLLTVFSYVFLPNREAMSRPGRSIALYFAPRWGRNEQGARAQSSLASRILTWRRLYIVIFALSFALPFYPYIPSINPSSQIVSVDAAQYQQWIEMMYNSGSPDEFNRLIFVEIQSGDRPLMLAAIYMFYLATGQNIFVTFVMISPILSLLLVVSVYFLVGAFTQNAVYRNLAAIITILSFQIIAGLYIGFFSNWLALVLMNASILFILKFLETRSPAAAAAMFVASIAILFVHITTWMYFAGATAIFLGLSAYADRKNTKTLLLLAIVAGVLAVEFGIDQAKSFALGSSNTVVLNSDITEEKLGASEFVLRWNNLRHLFTVYLWGTLANATLAMLALIWCIKAGLNDRLSRFMLGMFFVGSIPIVIGSFDVQSRFVYNMPFHVAAALLLGRYLEKRQFAAMPSLIVAVILLDLGAYFMRSLANMYLVAPV